MNENPLQEGLPVFCPWGLSVYFLGHTEGGISSDDVLRLLDLEVLMGVLDIMTYKYLTLMGPSLMIWPSLAMLSYSWMAALK